MDFVGGFSGDEAHEQVAFMVTPMGSFRGEDGLFLFLTGLGSGTGGAREAGGGAMVVGEEGT